MSSKFQSRRCGTELRRYGQYPNGAPGEAGAFYRILLRHQQRVAANTREIGCNIAMVIGENMGGKLQAKRAELIEETLWHAGAGNCSEALRLQFGRAATAAGIGQGKKSGAGQAHAKCRYRTIRRERGAIEDQGIDTHQARRRFAQRPGRQRPAIHQAALIKYGDLDIARQAIVLQAVIAQQQIALGMYRQQGPGCGNPVTPDEYRQAAATLEQQGLVADFISCAVRKDLARLIGGKSAGVAATDDTRTPPQLRQAQRQP